MLSPNSVGFRGQEFCLVRKARARRIPDRTGRENERATPRAGTKTAAQRVALRMVLANEDRAEEKHRGGVGPELLAASNWGLESDQPPAM